MAALPWLLCVLIAPALITLGTLRLKGPSRKSPGIALYAASLLIDHAWIACEWLVLFACAHAWFSPRAALWSIALLVTTMVCWMAIDAVLFCRAGLRLRWGLFVFTPALVQMGYAEQIAQATRLVVAGSVGELLVQGALMHAAWPEQLTVIPWLGSVLALGCTSFVLRMAMPMPLSYAWNLRFASWQLAIVTAPLRWAVIAVRRDLRNLDGVPLTLLARNEKATPINPVYPLLREARAFSGTRHFELRSDDSERPHVICLFLESFRAADVGVCGATHAQSITPRFDALARKGVLWKNCHANATITSLSMLSALYGVPPAMVDKSLQHSGDDVPMVGLPQIFAERDYLTACFTDAPMEFENTRGFFLQQGFAAFYGTPSIKTAFPEAPDSLWNFDDAYLMRFHAAWLARLQALKIPTFSTLLTITNHVPWKAPDTAATPHTDVPTDSDYGRFLRTMHYTDACLGLYVDLLHEAGVADNTVLLVMGDHGQEVRDNAIRWTGECSAESTRVPLLLLAPGRVVPTAIDEIASHLDILPTLLDALNIHATHHGTGNSLVRVDAERQARTFHPFAPAAMAVQDAKRRFIYNIDAGKTTLEPPKPDDIRLRWHRWQEVQVMRHYLDHIYRARRLAPQTSTSAHRRRWDAMSPSQMPTTVDEAKRMLEALRAGMGQGRVHRNRVAVLAMVVHAVELTEAQRLELLRLLLTRVHVAELGELSDEEEARLRALVAMVQTASDLGPYEKSAVETARQLARIKPFLSLRVRR